MSTPAQRPGDKLKKALQWVCEILEEHPEKQRTKVFKEAEIRYDLTPKECEFLDKNFAEMEKKNC